MADRVEWIDYAKGFGIILVVIVHNLTGIVAAKLAVPPLAFEFTRVAFSFFMPLFFFLSGLFTERSLQRGVYSFVRTKSATVLYPFVLWTLIQGALQSFMSRYVVHAVTFGEIVRNMFTHPIAQLWFLEALFLMLVGYAAACQIGLTSIQITVVALGLSATSVLVSDEFPKHVLGNFVFLCLGALLRERVIARIRTLSSGALAVGFVLGIVVHCVVLASFRWNPEHAIMRYFYAILGIVWTIAGAELMSRAGTPRWLRTVGQYTMPILLMHIIVLNASRLVLRILLFKGTEGRYHLGIVDPRYLMSIVPVVVAVATPIAVTLVLERIHGMWLLEWPRFQRRAPV